MEDDSASLESREQDEPAEHKMLFEQTLPFVISSSSSSSSSLGGHRIGGGRFRNLVLRMFLTGGRRHALGMEITEKDEGRAAAPWLPFAAASSSASEFALLVFSISEANFNSLRQDQSLLIDFEAFPGSFIQLLEKCRRSAQEESAFDCVLEEVRSQATDEDGDHSQNHQHVTGVLFKIVETNEFKQLTHLCLRFSVADHACVTNHLKRRLLHEVTQNRKLGEKLATSQRTIKEQAQAIDSLKQEMRTLEERHVETLNALRIQHQNDVSSLQQASAEAILKQQQNLEATMEQRAQIFQGRIRELETQLEQERGAKASLDSAKRNIENEYTNLVETHRSLQQEMETLKTARNHLERTIIENKERIQNLEQDLGEKAESEQSTLNLLRRSEEKLAASEEACRAADDVQRRLEAVTKESEMHLANCQTQEAEVARLKSRIKVKNAIILKQEKVIEDCKNLLDVLPKEVERAKIDLEEEKRKNASLNRLLGTTKSQLEETTQKVESSRATIEFLNSELNKTYFPSFRTQPTAATTTQDLIPPPPSSSNSSSSSNNNGNNNRISFFSNSDLQDEDFPLLRNNNTATTTTTGPLYLTSR